MSEKQSRTEYNREYARKRRSTDEGRKQNVETVKKWRDENPEAYKVAQRELMRRLRAEKKVKAVQEEQVATPEQKTLDAVPENTEKSIRLGVALRVENNNQWGRKKKATIAEIENDFRRDYPDSFKKSRRNNIDFEITLNYKEGDDLETVIRDEILYEIHKTADWNNCYTDETRVYNLDDMDESWD